MSPMTGNAVMDLLLGKIAPSQPGAQTLQGTNQSADGGGFADLLGMLSGITSNINTVSSGDQKGLPILDLLAGDMSGEDVPEENEALVVLNPSDRIGALAGLIPIMEAGITLAQPVFEAVDKNTNSGLTAATPDQLPQQVINSMMLPREAVLPNPQVLALLNQVPVALPAGRFAVLWSKVTDGTLQMEVASQDSPNQVIKLSLPTALLHQTNIPQSNPAISAAGIAGQVNAGPRIPLADPFATTERFDQLLARVNVKEIEISPAQISATTNVASNQVAVTLAAENSGVPIVVAGRMNKNQIMASAQRRPQTMETIPGRKDAETGVTDSEGSPVKNSAAKSSTVVAASIDDTAFDSFSALIEKNSGVSAKTSGAEPSMAMPKGTRQERAGSAALIDRPAVRMTVQQEMPNLSHLEGRTLMIKLEPEYLGSARLHLTMRQDTLSARVMVETPQAKAAVEGSLSQLTDQLTKAGIKIDYIDVWVRGGGAQNQFFHKQTNWFRTQNSRVTLSRDVEAISPDLSKATISRPMAGYVAADRVNIYA